MKIKIIFLSVLMLAGNTYLLAQSSAVSGAKYFSLQREVIPPLLQLVDGSVQFLDADSNKTINVDETCSIRMRVRNTGRGEAVGCVAQISASGSTRGITFANQDIPTILPGETRDISIPIKTFDDVTDGTALFSIVVDEPNGYGIDTVKMSISTKAFEAPLIQIVDYTINGGNDSIIDKKMQFVVRVLMQNVHTTDAKDVSMQLLLPENVNLVDGDEYLSFPIIKGGEQVMADYQLIVSGKFTQPYLPLQFLLKESYGLYAEDKTILLRINQSNASGVYDPSPMGSAAYTGAIVKGTLSGANHIQNVVVIRPFDIVPLSSVLSTYNNEFARMEMRDRDESFPYALFRVKLQGVGNKVSLAKQSLRLDLGQMFQTEKTVTTYNNQILFLIPKSARNIYITCGDGCTPQLIYSGQLESNRIYEGLVEVK